MGEMDDAAVSILGELSQGLEDISVDLNSLKQGVSDREVFSRIEGCLKNIEEMGEFLGLDELQNNAQRGRDLLNTFQKEQQDVSSFLAATHDIRNLILSLKGGEQEKDSQSESTPLPQQTESESEDKAAQEKVSSASEPPQVFELDDVAREFFMESYENLDDLDNDFVALEEHPDDKDTLNKIFRAVHTIKGNSGFLGFKKLEQVAHKGENLLDALRSDQVALNPDMVSALLATIDAIREIMGSLENTNTEGTTDYTDLVNTLIRLQKGETVESFGEILVKEGSATQEDVESAITEQNQGDPRRLGEILVDKGAIKPKQVVQTLDKQNAQKKDASKNPAESNIRVDVKLLDRLMNLTGELVLSRNQILQVSNRIGDQDLSTTTQQLDLVTTELQESIMKTRMQPVATVWGKFNRVVRDLSRDLKKKIRLEMEGQETELDKTLLEAIKDPMTHLVRNSLDHGIESPEKRKETGKDEEGRLLLKAYHDGGHVVIEIIDDGGGIDPEKLKIKAIEKDLITEEQAAQMPDKEALHLIFRAGFSTAEQVTNVSGRGVGMDVVRSNIEKIGGSIDLDSQVGVGSTVRLTIPLTLAIVPALFIESANQRFAIPQNSLLELVRLEGDKDHENIENIHGARVYRLRDKLLPLVDFKEMLQLTFDEEGACDETNRVTNIIVLDADGKDFGLIVDQVIDTHEIVVKPLDENLEAIPAFSGATIMGDGNVALILDVAGIGKKAEVLSKEQKISEENIDANDKKEDREQLLTFRGQESGKMAVYLEKVFRLEKFDKEKIEQTGSYDVIQYRGSILPLIDLKSSILDRRQSPRNSGEEKLTQDGQTIDVVVCYYKDLKAGFVVDQIYDAVEQVVDLHQAGCREGVLGTVVVEEQVTEILDVEKVVRKAIPNFDGVLQS